MWTLEVNNLTKSFGNLIALKNCTLKMRRKSVVGLIGPNGAGKSTLINVVNGFCKPDAGSVYFKDERIDDLSPHEIARKGIGRTFQITRVFRMMSVMDNLLVCGLRVYADKKELKTKIAETLKSFDLYPLKDEFAGNLSGGQKKLLELARALTLEPDLLLLDEPFHGIHPAFKEKIAKTAKTFSQEGGLVLIVSHDIPSIAKCCDTVFVLCAGEVIAKGKPEDIANNEKVIEAYLGV